MRLLSIVTVATLVAVMACQGDASKDSRAGGGDEVSETKHDAGTDPPAGQNRLALEKSPYLLQHASNPVDWYPWGEEAFAAAQAQDKPIFLSIGYSTCHWCHVMEHESFEDEEVAALLNDAFICVKVDREERPDIDNIYMTVCQIMTGRGGWPLTLLLTPDRRPFFAGTYIPRRSMLGFIPQVKQTWATDRARVFEEARRITDGLQQSIQSQQGVVLGRAELDQAYNQLASRYDSTYGGFGAAPKFPAPHNLMFLLRRWKRTGDPQALKMVEKTLERMRRGGMYDHVGFGFHRYSTDHRWFLPHFEKMLYDQALLVMAYTEAYQATGNESFRRTADEVIAYVLRDMTDAKGGFYSAEDADSEGEEGKFYLWSEAEIRDVLGADADLYLQVYGVTANGNYEEEASREKTGTNIVYLEKPLSEHAAAAGTDEASLRKRLEPMRKRLFDVREKRIHPGKDDKILTDWNGLMIAALAKAGRAFDEPEYVRRARAAADFVLDEMASPDGALLHRYRTGSASITGMVDDYTFFVWGLLELYEATFDVRYLKSAIAYTNFTAEHFWDTVDGGYFFTSDDAEELIVRPKEVYDGAVPSGNSVAMLNLIRLGRITAEPSYEERARNIGRAFQQQVSRSPSVYAQMMNAVDFAVGPSFEIVIAGDAGADDTRRMTRILETTYLPSKVVIFRPEQGAKDIVELAPYTKEQRAIDGKATVYVCRNYACELPTTDVDEMMRMLAAP